VALTYPQDHNIECGVLIDIGELRERMLMSEAFQQMQTNANENEPRDASHRLKDVIFAMRFNFITKLVLSK